VLACALRPGTRSSKLPSLAHASTHTHTIPQHHIDYVKYSLPTATAITLLGWSLVEFAQGYAAAGTLPTALGQLKWGADYLMRAHTNSTSFVVQVRVLEWCCGWPGGLTALLLHKLHASPVAAVPRHSPHAGW
jgi:hypothetical protein